MTTLDVRAWAKRNLWPRPSGELATRPALRRLYSHTAGRTIRGGFSVQNPRTLEWAHYICDAESGGNARVSIFDENFTEWYRVSLPGSSIPSTLTHAIVADEILIGAPEIPTLWGIVGSSIRIAEKQDSDSSGYTAIDVPRGIITRFGARAVVANGLTYSISDAVTVTGGTLRSFVAQNQGSLGAPIFGAHLGLGGALLLCTGAGSFALDAAAAAVDIIGDSGADWRITSHHPITSYASTCAIRGRVYGLTRKGYTRIDGDFVEEELLDEPPQARFYGPRISLGDWSRARMFASQQGPIVQHPDLPCTSMHDLHRGVRSWWTLGSGSWLKVVGTLTDPDGRELLLLEDGIYIADGDADNTDNDLTPTLSSSPWCGFIGSMPSTPEDNPTVRSVQWSAAVSGSDARIAAAVWGDAQSQAVPTDVQALSIDSSSWGTALATARYMSTPLRSVRSEFDQARDDVGIEVMTNRLSARVSPSIDVTLSDSATRRPTGR